MPDEEESAGEPEPQSGELEEEIPEPPPHGRIPPEDEPAAEQAPSEHTASLADLTVYDTLRFSISLLAQQAWMRLGLQVAPGMAEPKVDLPQARVAIDSLEAIIAKLEPDSEAAEKRELENLLDNLRINYVKKAT